jgi:hypothetical protein
MVFYTLGSDLLCYCAHHCRRARARTTSRTAWLCQPCSTVERRVRSRDEWIYSTSWRFKAMRMPFTKTTL